jgi:hypothetical protein
VPESDFVDWLTWPADQLLRRAGLVAAWFFSEDATGFTLVQMGFSTIVLRPKHYKNRLGRRLCCLSFRTKRIPVLPVTVAHDRPGIASNGWSPVSP